MTTNYTSIFFFGPWLSGKTTLAKRLSKELDWEFIDMDNFITKATGKTIDELTAQGANWQLFREKELELLAQLLKCKNIVVGCGGGVSVNTIVRANTKKTFGQIENELLKSYPSALKVVLLPDIQVFLDRVTAKERKNFDVFRPLLDEKHASDLQNEIKRYASDPEKQREIYILGKVKSAQAIYESRVDLYNQLGDIVINTGKKSIRDSAQEVLNNL